jgi:hypothetical protein
VSPVAKASVIADCLENQFRAHDLRDCDHRQCVEAEVGALMAAVDDDTLVTFRPSDVSKE